MQCAWNAFINLVPTRFREDVDKFGKDTLQELRLRLGLPPELFFENRSVELKQIVKQEDLQHCINYASRYSPWVAGTAEDGYITAPGGHRVGICGRYVQSDRGKGSFSFPMMLSLRVARDFPGIGRKAAAFSGSVLIIGKPGCGKTTLLRDMIRQRSDHSSGSICVVDEKEELFPRFQDQLCFFPGKHTDVLSGCGKKRGIEMVLRNMTPTAIAIDEITAEDDCLGLLSAGWCGVDLFATAHAGSKSDLYSRPIYRGIVKSGLFQTLLVMHPDKSWKAERMTNEY